MAEERHQNAFGRLTRTTPIYAALLLAEATLAFCLGVFGNKVAEKLKIDISLVAIGAIVTILLLYLVTLARLRFETGERILPGPVAVGLARRFQHTVITVFPGGIVSGIATGSLIVFAFPGRFIHFYRQFRFHDYELVTFLIGALLLVFLEVRNAPRSSLLGLAAGYGLGIAAIVEVVHPESNSLIYTFVGTPLVMLASSVLVSSHGFKRFVKSFADALRPSA